MYKTRTGPGGCVIVVVVDVAVGVMIVAASDVVAVVIVVAEGMMRIEALCEDSCRGDTKCL